MPTFDDGITLKCQERIPDLQTSNDGTAKIWRIFEKQELIDYARAHIPRQLTKEQRKQFFLE